MPPVPAAPVTQPPPAAPALVAPPVEPIIMPPVEPAPISMPPVVPPVQPVAPQAASVTSEPIEMPQPPAWEEPAVEEEEVAVPPVPEMPAPIPPPPIDTGPWAPQLFWRPEQTDAGARGQQFETARVPVGQLDTMLNQAGEISIYRSRLEQQGASLLFQLNELTQTVGRVREQVRKLDIEAQAMVTARQQRQVTPGSDRYEEEFDPLEMDRYSRLQEMSRGLAESMTDMESLRGYLDELRGQNEMLLLQQARVTSELQQGLMRALMVPFARQVQRLERLVRQTAQEYGKKVRVEFAGVEAELDRKVLERMVPPLEHLLRNAIVHGVETPAERQAAGKSDTGVVSVKLSRDGAQLVIDVSDDGRGLNLRAIRAKAEQMGLIAPGAALSEADTVLFIFEPGFSTAQEVTQVAGRGVGMDVVNAEIKQLGGNIEIQSTPGKGAHFLIRLPLSLAITQALLIHVGEELYALPMNTIEGISRLPRAELTNYCAEDGPPFNYGGQAYRVRQMSELLHLRQMDVTEGDKTVPALLVRAGERRVALAVDEILGTREVVVKSVGLQVSTVVGVSGATIMPDGSVVVILDAPALVQVRLRRALAVDVRRSEAAEAEEARPLVMVVDDSITMRRVAERTLTRNGFRVSTAKDGMDALGKLQIEFPHIVLLDIEMPRLDGFELATYMRNSDRLHDVPIIMITSRSGEKHRARAEQIGVQRYLVKPYQEDELITTINELLSAGK
jgi:chemosensory pili system protein ChpA (sensor histidine kinase/response regulator)